MNGVVSGGAPPPLELLDHFKSRCGDVLLQFEFAVDRSERWMAACAEILWGLHIPPSDRLRAAASLLHLSIEHHQGIHVLITSGVIGSAFALYRPQFEAYVRGVWLHHCASEKEFGIFLKKRGRIDLEFGDVIKAIEKTAPGFESGLLTKAKNSIYRVVNDFTHGGPLQVGARNCGNEIVSNYAPKDVIDVVNASISVGLSAAVALAMVAENNVVANKLLQTYQIIHEGR